MHSRNFDLLHFAHGAFVASGPRCSVREGTSSSFRTSSLSDAGPSTLYRVQFRKGSPSARVRTEREPDGGGQPRAAKHL